MTGAIKGSKQATFGNVSGIFYGNGSHLTGITSAQVGNGLSLYDMVWNGTPLRIGNIYIWYDPDLNNCRVKYSGAPTSLEDGPFLVDSNRFWGNMPYTAMRGWGESQGEWWEGNPYAQEVTFRNVSGTAFYGDGSHLTGIGSGTVTSVSVTSGNGFGGSVTNANSTPAISITTNVNGLLKGNGTAVSAATSGVDFAPATSGASVLKGDGSGGFSLAAIDTDYQSPIAIRHRTMAETTFGNVTGATWNGYIPHSWAAFSGYSSRHVGGGGSGTVTSVSVTTANGFGGSVANATSTPAISITTNVNGLLKGNGTAISAAVAGADYLTPTGNGSGLTGITASQVNLNSVTNDAQLKRSANDFSSFSQKTTPASNDVLLIEDSAASGAKKYITIGNLPSSSGTSGSLLNVQYLTSGTNATYTPTLGTHSIIIQMVGGGGGGGGASGASSQAAAGGGGSSAAYLLKRITGFSGTGTYTVGVYGTHGSSSGGSGGTGGNTSFTYNGITYTADGGNGGAGMAHGTSVAIVNGGGPSIAVNGDINDYGHSGECGTRLSGSVAKGGFGGSGQFGAGGWGSTTQGSNSNAYGYGSGGSGATSTSSTGYVGSDGQPGIIIVWEFS